MIVDVDRQWLRVELDGRVARISGGGEPAFGGGWLVAILPHATYEWEGGAPLTDRERIVAVREIVRGAPAAQVTVEFIRTPLEFALDVAGVREPGFEPFRCRRPELLAKLSTPWDAAVFSPGRPWAAKRPVSEVAREFAAETGGVTFEDALRLSELSLPSYNPHRADDADAWHEAVAAFAQGASGQVSIVCGETVDPSSLFVRYSFPPLAANLAVTRAVVIDAATRSRRELALR